MQTNPTKEIAPHEGEAKAHKLSEIRNQFKGNSGADQATRMREALRYFPVSTFEARRYLDIMHPAGRIKTLRDGGEEIITQWTFEPSDVGRPHRIALYVSGSEAQSC